MQTLRTFASRRSAVVAPNGMVATTHPLVAMAALSMLQRGGNAADAAAAGAWAMCVMEPFNSGLGGDAFALVWSARERQVYALNASGPAPAAATITEMRRRGVDRTMPETGLLPVTVPGAVDGIASLLTRFGSMQIKDTLEPAIRYAEAGYPVPEVMATQWKASEAQLASTPDAGAQYLIGGRAPRAGQIVRLPKLARTLRLLADGGRDVFYRGSIADAIVRYSETHEGLLSRKDFEAYQAEWTEPIWTDYRGVRLYECPPNGQGVVAIEALNVLQEYDIAGLGFGSVDSVHLQIEALRLAFADGFTYVADPRHVAVPTARMVSREFATERRSTIKGSQADSRPLAPADTVYLTVVDKDRNAVSYISSLYLSFGSGVVAGDTGIFLQDRGACFSLDHNHPNALAPGKRPYQTIIPAMATRNNSLWLSFGVVGGFMQPQGHVQLLCNMVDHGFGPQTALDAPRFRVELNGDVTVESTHEPALRSALAQRGHSITPGTAKPITFGGGQIIAIDSESGALVGGSEPRKDGSAIGF